MSHKRVTTWECKVIPYTMPATVAGAAATSFRTAYVLTTHSYSGFCSVGQRTGDGPEKSSWIRYMEADYSFDSK